MESTKILTTIPLAGTYEEINLGNTNDLIWVLFTDTYNDFNDETIKIPLILKGNNKIGLYEYSILLGQRVKI